MGVVRYMVLWSLFLSGIVYGAEDEKKPENKELKKVEYSYINIDANVSNTPIFINNEEIGKTPIKAYKIEAGKPLEIKAIVDKKYYKKDLVKKLTLIKNTQKDIFFKFEKGQSKLLFIGDKAQLFIDNKFIRELNENNRVVKVDAGKNVEIHFEDGYKTRTLFKDIKVNQFYEVPYTLIYIPKDIRLYTSVVENLMWEDTRHAADIKIDWNHAKEYCEDLKLAGFTDWELPSIEQLTRLEQKYKDKIYYGYGKTFYWSSKITLSANEIWEYSDSRDFEKSKTRKPITEIPAGYVRCVRKLDDAGYKEDKKTAQENKEEIIDEKILRQRRIEKFGYDPEMTKDLKKFMLK